MSYNELPLGEIANVTKLAGYEFTKYIVYDEKAEIIAIRGLNIKNGVLDLTDVKKISRKVSDELVRSKLFKDDIVLTYTGTIGNVAIIKEDDAFHLAPNVAKITFTEKKYNPYFYYSYFRSEDFYNKLMNYSVGSTQATIPMKTIREITVPVPPLETQNKVSNFISSIDEKIRINKELIGSLEEMSQTIFKHWFIDFEFPNEEGLSYKSNGGKMVESELGEIPEGWIVGAIKDLCLISSEKINLDKEKRNFHYIGLEHMPQGSIALGNWESSKKVSGVKGVFNKGDILFGKLRPYFKKVGITSVEGVCSTDILVFIPKNDFGKAYLLMNLIQDKFIEYTTSTATGTRMPRTGWNQIGRYSTVIPPTNLLIKFSEVLSPMLEQIQELIHENIYLGRVRDSLLPKMLSGEIEIPDESVVDLVV
ncbi:hypothetical protein A8F94_05480 [Bacillus sp. FJAT-27225]|uniref:restriction endonuclease subunit S n=1 Tax=Bacillus sp. FJAT-27225 TaxID=1743144 RepID=UPI00080C244E|nr:restriction endonuclease subunit S [Bacillus sp. FJAT-27225]OCA91312.1 hypothetical protein A8F94_05480 [Bacillus sp. FJAT-27225]